MKGNGYNIKDELVKNNIYLNEIPIITYYIQ